MDTKFFQNLSENRIEYEIRNYCGQRTGTDGYLYFSYLNYDSHFKVKVSLTCRCKSSDDQQVSRISRLIESQSIVRMKWNNTIKIFERMNSNLFHHPKQVAIWIHLDAT